MLTALKVIGSVVVVVTLCLTFVGLTFRVDVRRNSGAVRILVLMAQLGLVAAIAGVVLWLLGFIPWAATAGVLVLYSADRLAIRASRRVPSEQSSG